jgi:hypothetical protein
MFGIPEWAIGVGFIFLAGSVARALFGGFSAADRLRGRKASRRGLSQAVEDLQRKLGGTEDVETRLGELEDVQRRLADVEERLDFAERMLAKQRDAERIVPPKS